MIVGLFCVIVGLFCGIGLFCVIVGLFSALATNSPYQTKMIQKFGLMKHHQELTDTFAIENK